MGVGLISAGRHAAFSGGRDGEESIPGPAVSPLAVATSPRRKEFPESQIAARRVTLSRSEAG